MVSYWLKKLRSLYERIDAMTSLTMTGKIFALAAVAALAVGALALFGTVAEGCRATVPVVVNNVNNNCAAEIHNKDGSIDYKGCRVDGDRPVNTTGSPGDDLIDVRPGDNSFLLSAPPSDLVARMN